MNNINFEYGYVYLFEDSTEHLPSTSLLNLNADLSDVANFPVILSSEIREHIIRMGPQQIQIDFPKTNGRSFSTSYFTKKESNGETTKREWLIYSKSLDAVHCFCCVLFLKPSVFGPGEGFSNWQHLSARLRTHEASLVHKNSYEQWIEMRCAILSDKTIDLQLNSQLLEKKNRLCLVFERLIHIILYLARQNLALRGSSSDLYESNNGNFL